MVHSTSYRDSNTFKWQPVEKEDYRILVYVRNQAGEVKRWSGYYTVCKS